MKYVWIFLVFFVINVLFALGVYTWIPEYRGYLVKEDSLVENLSAFFYISAFFLSLLFLLKNKEHRKMLIVVSLVGLLGFLDEISFGKRVFGFNMPHIYGRKVDAVHDFFLLGYKLVKKLALFHTTYVYLLIGVGAMMAVIVALKYRYKLIGVISNSYHKQTYIFALLFASLGFVALMIDLEIVRNNVLFTLEELFEMNAAIVLLFCCLSLHDLRLSMKPLPVKSAGQGAAPYRFSDYNDEQDLDILSRDLHDFPTSISPLPTNSSNIFSLPGISVKPNTKNHTN